MQYVARLQITSPQLFQLKLHATKKVKGSAAVERAILAEKKVLSLESKLQKIEKELERFQVKMRESPEMALMEEIAQLKGQLAASESREELERAHYKQALLEKEQYQVQLHRLAKSLKREQDRSGAHKRKEIEKLRLEFVGREELKQLDGDRLELQRIKNELRALNLVSTEADSPSLVKPELSACQPQLSQYPKAHETWLYSTEDNSSTIRKQYSSFPIMPASKSDDLRRLTQERDDLLATGVFDEKHAVIVELDICIAELKAANH